MWHFFLNNYRFTYVLIIATFIIGLISGFTITKESTPEVKVPVGTVSTFLNGGNSEDIERLITNEIEEKIGSLEELDTYTSVSAEGISLITVTFDADADIEDRVRALKDAVDEATPELPGEIERPVVKQISFDDEPVLVVSLAADVHSITLKQIAEEVQDRFERLSGISEVNVVGAYDREAQIVIDRDALERYNLSLGQVLQAIQNQNTTLPGGTLEYEGVRYPVRFEGDIEDVEEIPYIPVASLDGNPVYIQDIATVTDSTKKPAAFARVSMNGSQPQNAVSLQVKKRVGADVLEISDKVEAEIEEMKKDILKDATIFTSLNNADYIREDLSRLSKSGMQTVFIVTLILIAVLGWRAAILAGMSIPLSFLIAIAGLSYMGSTINFLSLFSLILALGILVDSAIVLTEGVYTRMSDSQNTREAAGKVIDQFKAPITSGVLTTIAAMVPMLFASGIIGEFIKHIPITVTLVLLSSLFVTLAFLPSLAARFLKPEQVRKKKEKEGGFLHTLKGRYHEKLHAILQSRRTKVTFIATLLVAFFVSLALPVMGILKVSMFPQGESEMLFFDVELKVSTTLDETNTFMRNIEEILVSDDRIESFTTNVGIPFNMDATSPKVGETPNLAHVIVNLKDEAQKDSLEMIDEYQENIKIFQEAQIRITQIDNGPPAGAPVSLKFKGEDLNTLEELASRAKLILSSIEGAKSIRSSVQDTEAQFITRIDRSRAAKLGINPFEIAQLIRAAVNGIEVTTIKAQEEDIDILVKFNLNPHNTLASPHLTNQASIDMLKSLTIHTRNGSVPLTAVIDIDLEGGQGTIIHEEGDRTVSVTAYTKKGTVAQEIIQAFQKRQDELELPEGYSLSFAGEAEDVAESFGDMFRAMFIGIFLIAAILVFQFNSFRQPIFVLATVPLALTGILPGLALMRLPLSFTAFVGVVALSGIVVNNAILLIDRMNENRRTGKPVRNSVTEAAMARFRPIILTTITTIAGILPLALSDVTWGPLGFTIAFGLAFSTILTLFVIPILYDSFVKNTN